MSAETKLEWVIVTFIALVMGILLSQTIPPGQVFVLTDMSGDVVPSHRPAADAGPAEVTK
jgi:hypothetical protein